MLIVLTGLLLVVVLFGATSVLRDVGEVVDGIRRAPATRGPNLIDRFAGRADGSGWREVLADASERRQLAVARVEAPRRAVRAHRDYAQRP